MQIESITVKGFRCFDNTGQSISLGSFACLVGPNASGKTAAMVALTRLFGDTQAERTVRPSDFHLKPGEKLNDVQTRTLAIEVKLAFPELQGDGKDTSAIPETFNQMVVDGPGSTPYCRVRLDATWQNDGTPGGDVEQQLRWILSSTQDLDDATEAKALAMRPAERARIRVIYVSATRDPSAQIKATAATTFGRLIRAMTWNGVDAMVDTKLDELRSELGKLTGLKTLNAEVQNAWSRFYDGLVAANVAFSSAETDASSLLEMLSPTFAPDETGRQLQPSELSDGLRSLFALSLPIALYQVEQRLRAEPVQTGFSEVARAELPTLTYFAIEEPENHLSPQYLGRVIGQLLAVAKNDSAGVMVSSHSPAILRRVQPEQVRFFLGGENRPTTEVRSLTLPDDDEEALKYVREAVRGHPELYFSRLVVLGEGPSEEIVLRRLFEASGAPLDESFIAFVPLGGRHVNHFWRLLGDIGIPFLTLLDLDREKEGAGWGRVQYVRDQLVALSARSPRSISLTDEAGGTTTLADARYDSLYKRDDRTELKAMKQWLKYYRESHAVFFSRPLDLDFSLLEAFPKVYKGLAPKGGGPRLPKDATQYDAAIQKRICQVLAANPEKPPPNIGSSYTKAQHALFPWYQYLFLDGSKPVAHFRAMIALEGSTWVKQAPTALRNLVRRAKRMLKPVSPTPPAVVASSDKAKASP